MRFKLLITFAHKFPLQASEFRSAIDKCHPDCRPILMSGRQKVADLNFALE